MNRNIMVCGKWPLTLDEGNTGFFQHLHNAQKNAQCFERALQGLPTGRTVVEHYGGVGVGSTVIQHVLRPKSHVIYEIDDQCIEQLRRHIPRATVRYGNANTLMGEIRADILVLDHPYHTVRSHESLGRQWNAVFAQKPLAVVWPDGSARRFHLHRGLYDVALGCAVTTEREYLEAYSELLWKRWGYAIRVAAGHSYTYLQVTEGAPSVIEFHRWSPVTRTVERVP